VVWVLSTYYPSSIVTPPFPVHDLIHKGLCGGVIRKEPPVLYCFLPHVLGKYRGAYLRTNFVENGEKLLINICRLNVKKPWGCNFQQGCWNLQSGVAYYDHCICTLAKSLEVILNINRWACIEYNRMRDKLDSFLQHNDQLSCITRSYPLSAGAHRPGRFYRQYPANVNSAIPLWKTSLPLYCGDYLGFSDEWKMLLLCT